MSWNYFTAAFTLYSKGPSGKARRLGNAQGFLKDLGTENRARNPFRRTEMKTIRSCFLTKVVTQ